MIVTCAELSPSNSIFLKPKKKVQTGVSNIRYLFIYLLSVLPYLAMAKKKIINATVIFMS
jgi:hypothetical protein